MTDNNIQKQQRIITSGIWGNIWENAKTLAVLHLTKLKGRSMLLEGMVLGCFGRQGRWIVLAHVTSMV